MIVIYIILFEVNCIDFSFVNSSFVIVFLVIYFHSYFLRVFCHLGGLVFLKVLIVLFFLYLVVLFEVIRSFPFLVHFVYFFFINIYFILCYLCLYSAILCSK